MENKALEYFSLQVKKFDSHTQFFQNVKVGIEVNDDTKEGKTTFSGMDEESLISVLVHFRPFYMKDSDLNFVKIANHILQDQSLVEYHPRTKDFLRVWGQLLNPDRKNIGGMSIAINDTTVNTKKNFDIWINEAYLHAEQYKPGSGKGLDQIKSHPVFENISRFSMIDLLQRLTILVISLNTQIVEKILKEYQKPPS